MEYILQIILEIIFKIILETIIQLIPEIISYIFLVIKENILVIKENRKYNYSLDHKNYYSKKEEFSFLSFFIYFLLGSILGWLSLFLYPKFLVLSQNLRIVSLFFIPFLIGLIIMKIDLLLSNKEKITTELGKFTYAFIFAFGVSLVRFALSN